MSQGMANMAQKLAKIARELTQHVDEKKRPKI